VLRKLSREIAECYRLANKCRDSARLSHDAKSKEIYSLMERHWIFLARSYEFTERLEDFTAESRRKRKKQD
jgi:hypothetical protein